MCPLYREGRMIDEEAKRGTLNRPERIEGQVQGIQRMVAEQKYCVDALLQVSAVQGALEQVSKRLLGQPVESCVSEAFTSGNDREQERRIEELLGVFSHFGRPGR